MSFIKILEAALEPEDGRAKAVIQQPPPRCSMCNSKPRTENALVCSDCLGAIERGYQISALAGRCANGAERDKGFRFHARMLNENQIPDYRAICGYQPGRRSAGWSDWRPVGREVTCPRCAKRVAARKSAITG